MTASARALAAAWTVVVLGGTLIAGAVPSDALAATTTVPPSPPTTVAPGSTSTSEAPARCDPVPPVALQFVGTARRVDETVVRFRIDEVRAGPPAGGTEVDVTFVRDARFLRVGTRYLVTTALDAESATQVSKVRTLRGADPRCVAKDPIYTTLADGTAIDTGVFSGLKGTRGRVLRAVLLPIGVVVGALVALVAVKWILILIGRGVRRLTRRLVS